ncbi:uncharacterized protein [Panulirus ornatus]|uniref:uncharacterized protein isoform X2 n=1 Tax=Panulirus ornatus TaxID=150431 RepID=UPI003A840E87
MVDKRRVIVTVATLLSWLYNTSDASGDGLSYGDGMTVFLGGDGETDGVIESFGGRTRQESNISSKRLIYDSSVSCTVDEDSCVLENINCTHDDDCKSAFPNLEQALELGSSPVPHPPICKRPSIDQGYCTCGRNQCVSTSKQFGRGTLLYYCGPCVIYDSSVSCTVDEDSCVLENISCTHDDDCKSAFPNLEQALELGRSSPVPHPPICKRPSIDQGYCTCGRNQCVSTSKQFGRGTLLYYCGPCGYVGSQCNNGTCLHEMAVCRDSYCQCKDDGVFYEFSYCEIPYRGYEMALQMAIIICIVIAVCLVTASFYTMIIGSLPLLFRSRHRQERQEETQEVGCYLVPSFLLN